MRNRTTRYLTGANPKLVQSWNKYNLYHLKHLRLPPTHTKSFFQQKWAAKSLTRAYHGEQVRESQWERMFSRRLRGVVPMTAAYLGENDGSVESAGRGAGLDRPNFPLGSNQGLSVHVDRKKQLPWMQMTFAPLERRLDVAVFRALFASSTRQARQFVVHGGVTVNGKKMRFPGYLLNPGDMFQVDPELVMYATGAPKTDKQRRGGRQRRVRAKERREKETQTLDAVEEEAAAAATAEKTTPDETVNTTAGAEKDEDIHDLEAQFARLTMLVNKENEVHEKAQEAARMQKKKEGKSEKTTTAATSSTTAEDTATDIDLSSSSNESLQSALLKPNTPASREILASIPESDLEILKLALQQVHENPIDTSKPYATPWRPRDYMSAFAFIPRYLEVNQNICAAVYVRHPVVRPGLAEVPTPFPEAFNQVAFGWYLRRR
ncbi:Ribosomal protein S4/S9 [Ascosphaera apis ARSEF 7405]|uniref:Small ribosomal subunit protein uS4m n=1 Tax=Ascosphaera apis ARSEF 7405 TaxID=392613 RepID=A0A167YFD8_9EURO|nr:Ribosomal protein S4/S9 [Ascosphaera apis ARSEF 7405]